MPEFPPADPHAPLQGTARHINQTELLIIIWTCFSVATVFVLLRLTVRWRQNRSLLADDYWIAAAWVCLLVMSVLQTEQMEYLWATVNLQSGRISPTPETIEKVAMLSRWQFPIIKLFWTVLWCVKASFLAVFYRLVQPFTWYRRLWILVTVFVVLAYLGSVISSILTCSPMSDYFKPGACSSPSELRRQRFNVVFSTAVDVVSDIMIMILPLLVLPSLRLDTRKKVGLGIAFCIGILIVCVAIVRMTQVIIGDKVDIIGLAIWGAVETATSVIVGSLPPLKSLLTRGVRRYQTSSKKSTSQQYRYGGGDGSCMGDDYIPPSKSRNIMITESIPLDDRYQSAHQNGGIYVQRTFDMHVENDTSSREDDDEIAIVKGRLGIAR